MIRPSKTISALLSRREFARNLAFLSSGAIFPGCVRRAAIEINPVEVNDVQSQLNATVVSGINYPRTSDEVAEIIWNSKSRNENVAICGGRHAMGGQQFAANSPLIDTSKLDQILALDRVAGTVTFQSGIHWPALIEGLLKQQTGVTKPWTIREKQTGVDHVAIGGSIASNVHGRGLTKPPFVSDIESFRLVDANANILNVSRLENSELFSLVCGGYGLFGIVTEVTLRLAKRSKVRRVVEVIPISNLLEKVKSRVEDGFIYGDCQYAVDLERDPKSYPGVFSCYKPVDDDTVVTENVKHMTPEAWAGLYELLRKDKHKAFQKYSDYYLGTNDQVYWSDTHQLAGDFFRGYRDARDKLGGSELILEVYVNAANFLDFMVSARKEFLARNADVTFGTIRFIKRDSETFLAWAKEDFVCIVCNLHVVHTPEGIEKVKEDFRALIDQVLKHGGCYYLTYHRYARADQILKAYPQFKDFLRLKKKYDTGERFQSDWYRHYAGLMKTYG